MKNFEYNRFLQTLKWNIITEKKTMLTHTLAFVAAFLLIQLFYIGLVNMFQNPGPSSVMAGMLMNLSIACIMTYYYASGILGNARTKEQRTTMLMLPASNAEKFWARLAYVLIVIPLLIIAALIVATLLRMGIQLLLGHDYIVFGLDFLMNDGGFGFLGTWSGHLFGVSIFVLGGVLFRKHPFIWTWVSMLVVFFAIGLVMILIIKLLAPPQPHIHVEVEFPRAIGYALATIFTVFNFWLSYRLFCRLQLVQHKWFNV